MSVRLTVPGQAGLPIASATSASVASGRALINARIFASSASSNARWSSVRAVERGAKVPESRSRWVTRRTHDSLHPNASATSADDPDSACARATRSRRSIEYAIARTYRGGGNRATGRRKPL